jgi:hypothetical protein
MRETSDATGSKASIVELCAICGRVLWGNYFFTSEWARHEECQAGSDNWIEAQRMKPKKERSKLLRFFCPELTT